MEADAEAKKKEEEVKQAEAKKKEAEEVNQAFSQEKVLD